MIRQRELERDRETSLRTYVPSLPHCVKRFEREETDAYGTRNLLLKPNHLSGTREIVLCCFSFLQFGFALLKITQAYKNVHMLVLSGCAIAVQSPRLEEEETDAENRVELVKPGLSNQELFKKLPTYRGPLRCEKSLYVRIPFDVRKII